LPGAEASDACAACPAGFYCPYIATASPIACLAGYYCMTGVEVGVPCPVGTFSNRTGLPDSGDCTPCSPGKYCATVGLTAPTYVLNVN
jgi:hypothetical protein